MAHGTYSVRQWFLWRSFVGKTTLHAIQVNAPERARRSCGCKSNAVDADMVSKLVVDQETILVHYAESLSQFKLSSLTTRLTKSGPTTMRQMCHQMHYAIEHMVRSIKHLTAFLTYHLQYRRVIWHHRPKRWHNLPRVISKQLLSPDLLLKLF